MESKCDKQILLAVGDGPEGIEIYTSDGEGVTDWSPDLPALYIVVTTLDSYVKLGPFGLTALRKYFEKHSDAALAAKDEQVRELESANTTLIGNVSAHIANTEAVQRRGRELDAEVAALKDQLANSEYHREQARTENRELRERPTVDQFRERIADARQQAESETAALVTKVIREWCDPVSAQSMENHIAAELRRRAEGKE